MSNEIVQADQEVALVKQQAAMAEIQRLQNESYPEELFKAAGGGEGFGGFMPRISLFGANSEEVKRGKIDLASYGAVRGKEKELIPLGKNMLCVPLAWRPKAMDMSVSGKVTSFHNPHSKEFKALKAAQDADSKCKKMAGIEYLIWVPHVVGDAPLGFCTFFFGSKTAKNEAGKMRALLPVGAMPFRPAMCTAQLIENEEYSWFGPVVMPSSQKVDLPDMDTITATIMAFVKPKDSEVQMEGVPGVENQDR